MSIGKGKFDIVVEQRKQLIAIQPIKCCMFRKTILSTLPNFLTACHHTFDDGKIMYKVKIIYTFKIASIYWVKPSVF